MENLYIDEEKLVKHITPKIEYRIVQSIINTLEEQFYPPEEMIREEFIKAVKETEKKQGKIFKNREELKQYLNSLEK